MPAVYGCGQDTAPGIHRRISGHYIPSPSDTLPPFPVYAALPRSEYYDGSVPPHGKGEITMSDLA